MRTKKAFINSSINILAYIAIFIPNLVIRKVFLESLGSDMLGLSSLYSNIIGWLSIVELGVSSAIIYSLYKPYADGDNEKIRAYIRFYGKFYRGIGFIILILGLCIVPFLKYFIETPINMKIVTYGYLLFLINSFISYIFSNKLCILNVSQQAYKITIATTISKLIIIIIQIVMLKKNPDFILYVSIQLIVNFVYFISINIYINRRYSWINLKSNDLEYELKKNLFKNIKALFMHKIGSLVINSTDNLVISKFVGLTALSNYTNYNTVIFAFQTVIKNGLDGLTASIGNLLTLDDKNKAYEIHKRIFFLNFWVVSFVVITLYNTLNQFIILWIGNKYLLDNVTFIIILINLYFVCMRGSVEQFQNGSGTFHQDRYAPIFESVINLITSIVLVKYIGITGVFIGTLISNFTVIFWTKPYVVYKYVFNKGIKEYFKMYFKYLIIGLIVLVISNYSVISFKYNNTIIGFIINCIINIIVINVLYLIIFFRTDEFKYYLSILYKYINKK